MHILDGPGEGTWSVFAQKVVEERDALREEVARLKDDFLNACDVGRRLETRVGALLAEVKRLEVERDDARCTQCGGPVKAQECAELRAEVEQSKETLSEIGAILSLNGCDCECDCSAEEHDGSCARCLGCRISNAMLEEHQ